MNRSRKVTFIIIFLAVIVVLLVLFILTLLFQPSTSKKQPPSPTRQAGPTPTLGAIQKGTSLEVLQVSADFRQNNLLRIDKQITIIFNKPINPETFAYELTPSVEVVTGLDATAKQFYIRGYPFWPEDQSFTLVVKSETQAQDGSKLQKDYTVNFKTGIPEEM